MERPRRHRQVKNQGGNDMRQCFDLSLTLILSLASVILSSAADPEDDS